MNHENSTLLQQDLHLLNNIDDHATYELRNLGVSTEEVTDVDTLNKRVNDFAPEQGWACYQSQLLAFKATTVKPNDNSGLLPQRRVLQGSEQPAPEPAYSSPRPETLAAHLLPGK